MKQFILSILTFLVVLATSTSVHAASTEFAQSSNVSFEKSLTSHKHALHTAISSDHHEFSIDLEEEENHKDNWFFATVLSFYAYTFVQIELPRLECFYFSIDIIPSLSRYILFEDFRI